MKGGMGVSMKEVSRFLTAKSFPQCWQKMRKKMPTSSETLRHVVERGGLRVSGAHPPASFFGPQQAALEALEL